MNKTQIQQFRDYVIKLASSENFVHHKWFVVYHLEIVEKLALDLCSRYSDADAELVKLLVWFHDFGKIVDFGNQYQATLTEGKKALEKFEFSKEVIEKVLEYVQILDKKEGLDKDDVPIEIKIVSSSDGASHLVGPFFSLWFYENPDEPIKQLMQDSIRKLDVDWNKKIVLPEVKKEFKKRYEYARQLYSI